jgi:DegV family protein with EDD domain
MTIRIVTDSTCDLPQSLIEQHRITVVPLYVTLDGASYRDGVDLTREGFYARLRGCATPPKTASPGPAAFAEAYRRLADEGATGIISLHLTATLSNICSVAQSVARETEAVPIRVVDSGNLSLGTGLAALAAAGWARAGATLEEVTARLGELARRSYSYAVLDTLEYVRRSGRISTIVSTLGSLLHIRPLLGVNNGVISVERMRTARTALARLSELVGQLAPLRHLSILHTAAPERAEELRQQLASYFPAGDGRLQVIEAGPVVGVHMGPGVLGLTAVTARSA